MVNFLNHLKFICLSLFINSVFLFAESEVDIIDCHTHFYDPSRPEGVPWPNKDSELYKTVLPEHLKALKTYRKVTGTVIVEASAWVEDNAWLLNLAENDPFIVGIVGRLTPGSSDFIKNLDRFKTNQLYLGIRVSSKLVTQLLTEDKLDDFIKLAEADLSLDVNGGPETATIVAALAKKIPKLRIVINHIANVAITSAQPPLEWQQTMEAAAKCPNVSCKVSALVEGAARNGAKASLDLNFYRPYLDVLWNAFGEDRLIYGSNWPVSDRAATYHDLQKLVYDYFSEKGDAALKKFCSLNAKNIYKWIEREGRIKKKVLTFEDDIKPIFKQHCLKCHGEDKQKKDLNLQTYPDLLKGSSGGEVVVAGRSSKSMLLASLTDPDDDARMPPKKPPIPNHQIDMIRDWIDAGMRESSHSDSLIEARDDSFNPSALVGVKPEHAAMPENLPKVAAHKVVNPLPILAMDVSPWAPLIAISGQEQIRLIHAETKQELGLLPFPEGVPHVIRFSQDGTVLMVAGGRPVESGKVVLYNVTTGRRLSAIGDEIDAVLAADLSPDQTLVALGGSGKIVKVYSTLDGRLKYKLTKHTDWITALSFSPDGKRLASADRQGGLKLWDAESGGLILNLEEHKHSICSVDWRSDSKILASVGDDGLIAWWDVSDGWPLILKANAHPPIRPKGTYGTIPNGILCASFGSDGTLMTAGRNKSVSLWNTKGERVWNKDEKNGGIPLQTSIVTLLNKNQKILIMGDSIGQLKFWRINL